MHVFKMFLIPYVDGIPKQSEKHSGVKLKVRVPKLEVALI